MFDTPFNRCQEGPNTFWIHGALSHILSPFSRHPTRKTTDTKVGHQELLSFSSRKPRSFPVLFRDHFPFQPSSQPPKNSAFLGLAVSNPVKTPGCSGNKVLPQMVNAELSGFSSDSTPPISTPLDTTQRHHPVRSQRLPRGSKGRQRPRSSFAARIEGEGR